MDTCVQGLGPDNLIGPLNGSCLMTRRIVNLVAVLSALWMSTAHAEDASVLPGESTAIEDGEGDDGAESEDGGGAAPSEEAEAPKAGENVEMSIYRELKTVESQVDDLKERVFRSKARLLLLEEKVIRGVVSGAKAVLRHVNHLGPAYELESITYYFDGNPVYQKTAVGTQGGLGREKRIELFEANIPPGNHTLSVTGVLRGRGSGLFAYLSDYTFQFSSSYSFVAEDGKTTRLDAVLYKKGGALADFVEGPAVDFRFRGEKHKKGDSDDAAAAEGEAEATN